MRHILIILMILTLLPLSAAQVELTLLDPGAEPRTALRYRPEVGTVLRLRSSFHLDFTVLDSDILLEVSRATDNSPSVTTTETEVVELTPEGNLVLETRTVAIEGASPPNLPAEALERLEVLNNTLMNLTRRSIVTPWGETLETSFEGGAEIDPQVLEEMLASPYGILTRFPEEAVGVGAVWELRATSLGGGFEVGVTLRFTLVAHDDERITLAWEETQEAQEQTMMDLASQIDITLLSLSGTGEGQSDIDLRLRSGETQSSLTIHRRTLVETDESLFETTTQTVQTVRVMSE